MALRDMTLRQETILGSFDYHRPSPDQAERIERNRLAFKVCALSVFENTPEGPDQTAALRQLHESMMTANKAIALEPGTERVRAGERVIESQRVRSADDPNPAR